MRFDKYADITTLADDDIFMVGQKQADDTFKFKNIEVSNARDVMWPVVLDDNTLFVSPAGDDATAVAGDIQHPYATLAAINIAGNAGKKVVLLPGTHNADGLTLRVDIHWHGIAARIEGIPFEAKADTAILFYLTGVNDALRITGDVDIHVSADASVTGTVGIYVETTATNATVISHARITAYAFDDNIWGIAMRADSGAAVYQYGNLTTDGPGYAFSPRGTLKYFEIHGEMQFVNPRGIANTANSVGSRPLAAHNFGGIGHVYGGVNNNTTGAGTTLPRAVTVTGTPASGAGVIHIYGSVKGGSVVDAGNAAILMDNSNNNRLVIHGDVNGQGNTYSYILNQGVLEIMGRISPDLGTQATGQLYKRGSSINGGTFDKGGEPFDLLPTTGLVDRKPYYQMVYQKVDTLVASDVTARLDNSAAYAGKIQDGARFVFIVPVGSIPVGRKVNVTQFNNVALDTIGPDDCGFAIEYIYNKSTGLFDKGQITVLR